MRDEVREFIDGINDARNPRCSICSDLLAAYEIRWAKKSKRRWPAKVCATASCLYQASDGSPPIKIIDGYSGKPNYDLLRALRTALWDPKSSSLFKLADEAQRTETNEPPWRTRNWHSFCMFRVIGEMDEEEYLLCLEASDYTDFFSLEGIQ